MEIGKRNVSFGWFWILVGLVVGAVMGTWAFNGPLPSPVGDYSSLPRRMLRLSHIAFIMLGIINILYGYGLEKIRLRKVGSVCMIYGAILMPVFLIAAVFFEPLKYLTMIPATLVVVAVSIMVFGQIKK